MKNITRKAVVLLLGLLASFVFCELALVLFVKEPPENVSPQFKYNYLDIYSKAFEKFQNNDAVMYRSVRPLMEEQFFPAVPNKHIKRVFLIGESTAQQYDTNLLQTLLQQVLPQFDFDIINCGMGAYDAYRTRLIGEEIVDYQPDLILVIVGNSEFHATRRINRFHYLGLLSKSRLFRLITDHFNPPLKIDNLEEANSYYQANIEDLFETIKNHNIPAVLCTLPVNYRYFNCTRVVPLKYLVLNMLYLHFNDYDLSEKFTRSLPKDNNLESYIYYQLGKLADKRRKYQDALKFYSQQMESFIFPITCPPSRNDLIRHIANNNNILLADVQHRFEQLAPNGLPGFDLFKDNNHVWPSSYQIYSEEIVSTMMTAASTGKMKIFAPFSEWKTEKLQHTGYEQIMTMIQQDKENYKFLMLMQLVFSVTTNDGPLSMEALDMVSQIYSMDSNYLNTISDLKQQVADEMKRQIWVTELQAKPDSDQFWSKLQYHIGVGLMRLGLLSSASKHFDRAVKLDGNSFEPFLFRGINLYLTGKKEQAIADFEVAHINSPAFDWSNELKRYLESKVQ